MAAQDHGEHESHPQNSSHFLPEYASEVSPLVSLREGAVPRPWQETFGADESLSQTLLDALPETIAVIDQVGTIRMINQAWKRFAQANSKGQDADVLALGVGANYLQVCRQAHGLNSQEAVAALQGIERVLQGRQTHFTLEYPCHSIAQRRWFQMNVTPLPQQRGAIIMHHDITDWKLNEEFQANVINLAHDAIMVRSPADQILSWTHGAETLYGWSAQEALGKVVHTLLQTRFPLSQEAVNQRLEQQGRWEGELIHTCRDGTQVTVESRQVLLHDERGQPGTILEINRDISTRRRLEHEREVLLRLVSHELKTPITTSQFALNLLAERVSQTGDEQAASRLYTIDTQLTTLRKLVDDLLEKTALEAGTLPIRPEQFAIDDLVRETVEALSRTELTHTLLIEEQAHCHVYADRQRTGQILLNLLTNALKYSPPGKPVRVKATAAADVVTLSVQDQGAGIPAEQQARIFGQFVRLPATEQTQIPGLGLGLYIAAELVKQQGGHIWVKSTPGKGSIFAFTLPRYRPQP